LGTEPKLENQFVNHYNALAMRVAQVDPRAESDIPAPAMGMGRELTAPQMEDRWPLSLMEALRIGIENSTVVRQNAQFMSPNNPVMQATDTVPSVFDPPIQNAGVLFGSRGVDASLSDFDPRLSISMKSGNDQTVDNTTVLAPQNNILENNYTQTQSRLDQQLLSGGIFSIVQNWNYSLSNQPQQLFNSGLTGAFGQTYTGTLGAEFRQPLWSGGGREFTSIAGPASQRARGFSLVSQGIVIAHINKRLTEIDFQENLQNLAREIGDLYWDLYQNYQDYEAEHATSKVALGLWERMKNRIDIEAGVEVAQAEDAYFESKAREEQSLSNLFLTEAKLRRLLGVSLDDHRMIYPIDEPRADELKFDRAQCLYEALCNRIELTRQKANIHSLQLQLSAARKLVAPKLDFVSGYALNGFGNNFYSPNTTDIRGSQFNSAVSNLFTGRETSWNAGFEYSIPLWLRQERAQVRQLELRIVKARAVLAIQEDEIAHELNSVLMTIKRSQSMSKITFHRIQAARRRVNAAQDEYEAGTKSNDLLLRALTSQTQAQVTYSRSITEYNKALRDLLFRTGHLLNSDGISLLGVDGLPVLPPPGPTFPKDGQSKPGEQLPPGPDDPQETPENPDQKPAPKPRRKQPVAEFDRRVSDIPPSWDEVISKSNDEPEELPPLPPDSTESEVSATGRVKLEDNEPEEWDESDLPLVVPAAGLEAERFGERAPFSTGR